MLGVRRAGAFSKSGASNDAPNYHNFLRISLSIIWVFP
ncbi:hypothetical protein AMP9_0521 [plant metagenome]|uniref:Uncharacterized protein n=1 Tax=plant metagenome TaxID=1297885 RepID=A0A484NUC8_9ZZZZ